jgi:hypothetical protein
MKAKEVIEIDWNSEKSIKSAERKKARLENLGYTLSATYPGLNCTKMVYITSRK